MDYKLPVRYSRMDWRDRRAVREQYVREQGGKCMWCNEPLDGPPAKKIQRMSVNWSLFPPNFRKYPIHLQHDHETDLTEGAVHAKCNAVMWQYHLR